MPGTRIGGRYELVRKIAEGGMGAVYEAQHTLSKKTVALKVLFPHIGRNEAARQRFLREVSAPAQIGHDGIVEVYDAGFDDQDGSLFVAMELLRGETLRDRLSRGGLNRDQVLDLFEQLLEPLAAAHAKGIVHRDLKPENVYLHRLRDGREVVKLLDFGIARDLDAKSANVTQTGVAMGTPHYMAPEQAMSARDVSCPADVWAVGTMLYEALSGRTPFQGETASAIVVQACTQPHDPLGGIAPLTPAPIAALVDRCLEKEPSRRPADAAQLLGALRAARGKTTDVRSSRSAENPTLPFAPGSSGAPMPTPATSIDRPPDPIAAPGAATASAGGWGSASPASYAPPLGGVPTSASPGMSVSGSAAPLATPLGMPASNAAGPVPTSQPSGGPNAAALTGTPRTPARSGMLGRVLLVGGVLALGLALVIGALASLGLWAARNRLGGGSGTLRVVTSVPGQLWIDGALHGPVLIGGEDVSVSAGDHLVEIRNAGTTLASENVTVVAGGVAEVRLVRGVFAGSGVGPPETSGGEQTLTGTLAPGDQTLRSGEYMDAYEFSWTSGRTIHIEASSRVFDTYLILRWPSGRQLDNDDARGTDSVIEQRLDESGRYRVIVTSFRPGETGPYTLTIR